MQFTLTALMLGLAVGQACAGPLSDAIGRRRPALVGVGAYSVSCVLCAVSPSIYSLVGLRFAQGVAGGTGIVVARAVLRDTFSGRELTRAFSTLVLIMGAAPVLAPSLGSLVLRLTSWRGVFLALAAYGVVLLVATAVWLDETLPRERRRPGGLRSTGRTFGRLLRDRTFFGYALAGGFGTAAMFAYIAGSPFVLQEIHGISTTAFGVIFGLNAAGFVGASRLNRRLVSRFDSRSLLLGGVTASAVAGLSLLAVTLAGLGLAAILGPLFLAVSSVGMILPNATALALAPHPDAAGTAAAFAGVLQFGLGGLLAPLVGIAGASTAVPLALVVAASGTCALTAVLITRRPQNSDPRTLNTITDNSVNKIADNPLDSIA